MRDWKRNVLLSQPPFDTFAYTNKVATTASANLLAYWPLAELTGSTALDASGNGRNGAYTAATLGQVGIGDGRNSASFDGSTSFVNIFSASLAGAFNNQEGTAALWIRVSSAGVWTDSTTRRALILQADTNNRVVLSRDPTNNRLEYTYRAGGTVSQVLFVTSGPTAFFHVAITWSKAGDAVKAYLNGAQVGTTQTGLGVWAGALANNATVIGAASTAPANVWSGFAAHAAIWSTPLSGAQVATLAVVP